MHLSGICDSNIFGGASIIRQEGCQWRVYGLLIERASFLSLSVQSISGHVRSVCVD